MCRHKHRKRFVARALLTLAMAITALTPSACAKLAIHPETAQLAATPESILSDKSSQSFTYAANRDAVTPKDLTATANGDGMFTLSWTYRNLGDYNQDGTSNVADISQLARYFGESVTDPDSVQAVVDGNGDGLINVADITPLALNFGAKVGEYSIHTRTDLYSPGEEIAEVPFTAGTGPGKLKFSYIVPPADDAYYFVMAHDGNAGWGNKSNFVMPPYQEPRIFTVYPASGFRGEMLRMRALCGGAEPLSYSWDFGGAGEPATSTEAMPMLSLNSYGGFTVNLAVSNSYGQATTSFTLSVTSRMAWYRTLGIAADSVATTIAAPSSTNFIVGGNTIINGRSSAVITSCDDSYGLRWVKKWNSIPPAEAWLYYIADNGDSSVAVMGVPGGSTDTQSLCFIGFNSSGQILWKRLWKPPACNGDWNFASNTGGNIAGTCSIDNRDVSTGRSLVCLFTMQGEPVWSKEIDFMSGPSASAISISDGIYVFGYPSQQTSVDFGIMKLDYDGNVAWARAYSTNDASMVKATCLSTAFWGDIRLSGSLFYFDEGLDQFNTAGYIARMDRRGDVIFSKRVSSSGSWENLRNIDDLRMGWYTACGDTNSELHSPQPWVIRITDAGEVVASSRLTGDANKSAVLDIAVDLYRQCIFAGSTNAYSARWEPCAFTDANVPLTSASFRYTLTDVSGVSGAIEGFFSEPDYSVNQFVGDSTNFMMIRSQTEGSPTSRP